MSTDITTRTGYLDALHSDVLREQTRAIDNMLDSAKRALLGVAYTLVRVQDGKTYAQDYESIHDYARDAFGYRRAMVNNLLRIGRTYVVPCNGGFSTALQHADGQDYTASQLQECLSIDPDEVRQLDAEGAISPRMSARAIRGAVKRYKAERDSAGEVEGETTKEGDEPRDGRAVDVGGKVNTFTGLAVAITQDCSKLLTVPAIKTDAIYRAKVNEFIRFLADVGSAL